VDFNVPQNEDLTISDDSRIRAALPTIKMLRDAGAKVILASHLGRPKGGRDKKFSLKPAADRLSELLGSPVGFVEDCIGESVASHVGAMKDGDVVLLENVRFYPEEEKNDAEFAKKLAANADLYVNDAFGTAHRAHASTEGVAHLLKPALAGLLMDKELKALSSVLDNPVRPFATVIGGAKVSSKIGVLENLLGKVDVLVIGGAMAFSFLKAQGKQVGKSLVEDDRLDFCKKLLDEAQKKGVRVILPEDVVCAPEFKEGAPTTVVSVDSIPADQMGLDIGPKSSETIKSALSSCKTILWNGPLGAFETKGFEKATFALVDLLVDLTARGTKTLIGGGDSVAAIETKNVNPSSFTHVSTGGGASLEFLEGIELPGVACLDPAQGVGAKQ
jgi:phosphoglycerate kinase